MDEVVKQHGNIMVNKTITTDGEQRRGAMNGKKRARKETEPKEEREKKRAKVDEGASDKTVKVSIKKIPKPNATKGQAQSKATSSKENSTGFIEPDCKWNVLQPIKVRTPPEATQSREQPSLTKLKPRIWTSSREELAVLLPDLAGPKCLNGVSWLMYETPMILLDESTTYFDISLQEDSVTLDLLITREFTSTWPPRPEKAPDLPENLTVNGFPDDKHSNLGSTVTLSSEKPPKTRRTKKSAPTGVTTLATGSTNSTQTPPEGATLIDVCIPLPTYTPHELSTKTFKARGSEIFVAPPVPIHSQGEPAVESVEPYGSSTKAVNGPFGDAMKRGRRIKATGSKTDTPGGVWIDFSPPSVPSYAAHKHTGGSFSELLPGVHSNRGIGNTATKDQHEASNLIRPWDPTKFREQNHSTTALMFTDRSLQTGEAMNGYSNMPIPTTVLGHQSQGHDAGQAELVRNQLPTSYISTQPDQRIPSIGPHGLIEPLYHRSSPYETKYTVTTNTSYISPDSVNKLLTQTVHSSHLQHSPSPSSDRVEPLQLSFANVVLNAGAPPQMQNTSIASVPPPAVLNNHNAVWNYQIEPDLNKLHSSSELSQPTPSASKYANPAKQITTSQSSSYKVVKTCYSTSIPDLASQKHTRGPPQPELKSKLTNPSEDQPTTHIDLRVDHKPKIEFQAMETLEPTNCASNEAKVKQIRDLKALQDAFIPSTVPEEIQAIIDAYLSGRPLLLVISDKKFFDYWSLRLPEEFGFSMLGYFRILGVQESRVHLNNPVCPLKESSGSISGRVKWHFRLRWSPGGEEWILPKHDKNLLEHPWWKPPPTLSILPLEAKIVSLGTQFTHNLMINHAAPGISQEIPAADYFTPPLVVSNTEYQSTCDKDRTAPFEPESTFDTTPRYRAARLSNVNYKFRHAHLRELYHSHVPLQLLAPYGRTVLDSSFPRGWLCETCGKMNFQAALRHRMCSSSFCKGLKPDIAPYVIPLIFMRDPQDNLSTVLPYNEPMLIDLVDTWEDGTRTLPYYIHDDENVFIKHIFTRNLPPLQLEATRLLHLIQIEVELVRPIGENSPYFQYSAHAPKDDASPTTSKWPNVPLCIHHAKDLIQHQAIWFGELEKEQLLINHLCLLAWVASGTKRGPAIIRAKEKCVVFHAFGCNITVLVTPLSSKAIAPVKVDEGDFDALISMDDLPPDEPDVIPGWITGLDEEEDAVEEPSQEDKERWFAANSKKASNSKRPFLFTLVHGDVLVFYGDDFEYSLKRAGTSFLLIASYQNDSEPQA